MEDTQSTGLRDVPHPQTVPHLVRSGGVDTLNVKYTLSLSVFSFYYSTPLLKTFLNLVLVHYSVLTPMKADTLVRLKSRL